MDMTGAFPGAHYKAADIMAGPIVLTIAAVAMGKVGDDTKPIMKFYEGDQDMVLNVTNSNTIVAAFGAQSEAWAGRQIQLFATKVQFGAEMVDAIRVTPVVGAAPAGTPPAALAPGVGAAPALASVQLSATDELIM